MNPFDAIGNFFGGLFGKKKKEERPKPQVTVKQPPRFAPPRNNPFPGAVNQTPGATVKMPNLLIKEEKPKDPRDPFNGISIGGVKMKAPTPPANGEPNPSTPKPFTKEAPKLTPQNSTPKQRLDAALVAPKKNQGTTKITQIIPSAVRGVVKGTADLADFAVDASTNIIDNGLGKNGIGGLFGKDWSPKTVQKTKGIKENIRKFSDDVEKEQIKQNGADTVNNMIYSVGQFVDPAVIVGGVGKALVKGSTKARGVQPPSISGVVQRSEDEMAATKTGQQLLSQERQVAPVVEVPTERTTRINQQGVDEAIRRGEERAAIDTTTPSYQKQDNAISTAPVVPKAPAITSANRPATTVKPPSIIAMPEPGGVRPPAIETPTIPNPTVKPPATPQEIIADATKAIDEAAVQAPNPAPAIDVPVIESPRAAETRAIAEAATPVAPVDPALLARQADNQAPTDAIAENIPSIRAYGNEIKLSEENGYRAVATPDGGAIYEKLARVGSNRKGDRGFERMVYDAQGNKLTPAQADAMVSGELRSTPPKVEPTQMTAPRVEPTRIDQPTSRPVSDVPTFANAPVDELGTIARKAATNGELVDDAAAEALGNRVGDAIEAEVRKLGTTWEDINAKVQAAWSKKVKDPSEAGLSSEEFALAQKAAAETAFLRSRVDPALIKSGYVDKFYSPRQTDETEFTQDLVNEISRDRVNGLRDSELDLSTTPYRQTVQRYANADTVLKDQLVDLVENRTVKDGNGDDMVEATGLKVSDETKAAVQEHSKAYVKAQDDAIRAIDSGDTKSFNAALREGDKAINEAIKRISDEIPLDNMGREVVDALKGSRQSYMQSTMRTNMFLNIANRAFDQIGKAYVTGSDALLSAIAKRAASKIVGNKAAPLAPGDRLTRSIARQQAKGTLRNQQNRNFATNVSLAGAGKTNILRKGAAKIDAAYRAAGTYITSLGDLSTSAARQTNEAILRQAKTEGVTGRANLEKYLAERIGTPEYDNIYRRVENSYAGYVGMPESLVGAPPTTGKLSKFLSGADNLIKNALENAPIPNRLKQELNDAIMPYLTGFAGSVSRMAKKGINAGALGIPQIRSGLKLVSSGEPGARAVGELMIARSLIDTISAYGLAAGGTALALNGHWTGSYPSDPNERARWEAEGIQAEAFAFDVDGKTVYIQPGRILGPLALPMVIPTVTAHALANGDSPQDAVGQIFSGSLGQFIQNMGVEAGGRTIRDMYNLAAGNEDERKNAGEDLLRTLGIAISNAATPAAGLQNNAANALDPYKRDVSGGILDVMKNRNPFTRDELEVKKDNLGNPIENTTQMSLGSSAVTVGAGQTRNSAIAVDEYGAPTLEGEIGRLADAKFEVMPARDVKNANSQDDAKILMDTDFYRNADDETKAGYMKDVLLGTKMKDISKDLNSEERSSLMMYKLQNEDQRKKWLEDNNNAATYYAAEYNNLDARGLLTEDDQNLENKEGAKHKMVRAQVDQDLGVDAALKQLYDDVSETEWRAMTNPEHEDYDPDTAGRLLAYDDARTAAGVSGKSSTSKKNKYVLKTGKYGSGRGTVAAGEKFTFASLPDSLLSGVTTSSKDYASDAPTFQPIADLKAPAVADIPRGRSISVKRGIQI